MARTPADREPADSSLNPALHREIDKSHGETFEGTDPMRTVSVKDPDEGKAWPIVWAVVAIVCLAVAIYYLFL